MICYQGGVHSMNQIVKTSFLQINSIPINISGVIKKDDRHFKNFFVMKKKLLSLKKSYKKIYIYM